MFVDAGVRPDWHPVTTIRGKLYTMGTVVYARMKKDPIEKYTPARPVSVTHGRS